MVAASTLLGTLAVIAVIVRIIKYVFIEKFNPKAQVAGASLANQNVIVTGANTGIGYVAAERLAKLGAHVFLACRSQERAQEAINKIAKAVPNAKLSFLPLDLGSRDSVRNCVAEFKKLGVPLHMLVNNAGLFFMPPKCEEEDTSYPAFKGYERMFITNAVGPFLLTELLIEELTKTRGKVVVVASAAHEFVDEKDIAHSADFKFEDLKTMHGMSNTMKAYGFSKLCNVWHTYKWHRKYHASTGITFNSLHPGAVHTEIGRNGPPVIREIIHLMSYLLFLTVEQGAQTTVHVAASPSVENVSGLYFEACKVKQTSKLAQSIEYQDKIYDVCQSFL